MTSRSSVKTLAGTLLLVAASACFSSQASAQQPFGNGLGFLPFGFYQPYGAQYGSTLRTPPYFATNPPVYYGARHSRPYGISPFASPPMVSSGAGYNSRLRSDFLEPRVPTPTPTISSPEFDRGSPCVNCSVLAPIRTPKGLVQTNPFVMPTDQRIAKSD